MNLTRLFVVTASVGLGLFAAQRAVSAGVIDRVASHVAGAWKPGTIPANGPASGAPTIDEWNGAREVDVTRSSEFHCETKVVREWFRSSCVAYGGWTLKAAECKQANGDACFTWIDPSGKGQKASIVQRLRRGQNYQLKFIWNPGAAGYVLAINVDQAGGAVAGF